MANQLVRTLIKLGVALGCGFLAETFVGNALDREADSLIDSTYKPTKTEKLVLKAGAALTGYAIGSFVSDQCGDTVDDVFTCYDAVKALTSGKKEQNDDEENEDGNA